MKWAQKYLKVEVAPEAIEEIEKVKQEDEKYFRDSPNRSFFLKWTEVDRIPESDQNKIQEIWQKINEKLQKNPNMTEEEANVLASENAGDIVSKYNIRIIIGSYDPIFNAPCPPIRARFPRTY